MKKLFLAILAIMILSCSALFYGCADTSTPTDDETPEVVDVMSEKFLYDFETFKLDLQLIKVRENFGAIDLNTNAEFVKNGLASAKVRPLGRYTSTGIRPYFIIPTLSETFNFNYSNFYIYENVSVWVYNAEETAVNMYMGLVFEDEALASEYHVELASGWNEVVYSFNSDEFTSFDFNNCQGIYFKFDNAGSRDIDDAPILYFDDLTAKVTDKPIISFNQSAYLEVGVEYDFNSIISTVMANGDVLENTIKVMNGEEEITSENGKYTFDEVGNYTVEVACAGTAKTFNVFIREEAAANVINGFATPDDVGGYAAADKAVSVSFDPYFSYDGNGSYKLQSNSEWPIIFTMKLNRSYNDVLTLKEQGYNCVKIHVYFDGTEGALKNLYFAENSSNWTYGAQFFNLETNRWHELVIPIDDYLRVCDIVNTSNDYRFMPIWNQNQEDLTVYISDIYAAKNVEPEVSVAGDFVGREYTITASAEGVEAFEYTVYAPDGSEVAVNGNKFVPTVKGKYTVITKIVDDEVEGSKEVSVYVMGEGEISRFANNAGSGAYVGDGSAEPCYDSSFSHDGNGSVKFTIDRTHNAQWSVVAKLPIEQKVDLFKDYDYFTFWIYMESPTDEDRYFTFYEKGEWGVSKYGWDVPVNRWYMCVMSMDIFVNAYNDAQINNNGFWWPPYQFGTIADNYLDLTHVYIDEMVAYNGESLPIVDYVGSSYLRANREYDFSQLVNVTDVQGNALDYTLKLYSGNEEINLNENKYTFSETGKYRLDVFALNFTQSINLTVVSPEASNVVNGFTLETDVYGAVGTDAITFDSSFSYDGNGSLKMVSSNQWPAIVNLPQNIGYEDVRALKEEGYDFVVMHVYVKGDDGITVSVRFAENKNNWTYGAIFNVTTNAWKELVIPIDKYLDGLKMLSENPNSTLMPFENNSLKEVTIYISDITVAKQADSTVNAFNYDQGGYVGDGSAAPCFDVNFSYDGNGSVKFTIDRTNNAQWSVVATLPVPNANAYAEYDYVAFRIYMASPTNKARYFTFYEHGAWGTDRYGWDVPVNQWYQCVMPMSIFVNAYNAVEGNFTWGANAFGVIADNYLDLTHVYIDDMQAFNEEDLPEVAFEGKAYVRVGTQYDFSKLISATDKDGNDVEFVYNLYAEDGEVTLRDGKYAFDNEGVYRLEVTALGYTNAFTITVVEGVANDVINGFSSQLDVEGAIGTQTITFDSEFSYDGNGSLKMVTSDHWPAIFSIPQNIGYTEVNNLKAEGYDFVVMHVYVKGEDGLPISVRFAENKNDWTYGAIFDITTNKWFDLYIPIDKYLSGLKMLGENTNSTLMPFVNSSEKEITIYVSDVKVVQQSTSTVNAFNYNQGGYVGDGSAAPCFVNDFSYDGNGSVKFTIDRGNNAQWSKVASLPLPNVNDYADYDYVSFRIYMASPTNEGRYFTFYERGTWGTSRYGWDVPVNQWYQCVMPMSILVNAYNTVGGNFGWVEAFGVITDNYLNLTHVYFDDMQAFDMEGEINMFYDNSILPSITSKSIVFDNTFSHDGNGSVKMDSDEGWPIISGIYAKQLKEAYQNGYTKFSMWVYVKSEYTDSTIVFAQNGTWGVNKYSFDNFETNKWVQLTMDINIFINAFDEVNKGNNHFLVFVNNPDPANPKPVTIWVDDIRAI